MNKPYKYLYKYVYKYVLLGCLLGGVIGIVIGCSAALNNDSSVPGGSGSVNILGNEIPSPASAIPFVSKDVELYLSEIYKRSDRTLVVEIYVEAIAEDRDYILLENIGLRSYYRDTIASVTTDLSSETDHFEFISDFEYRLYKGNFYSIVFSAPKEYIDTQSPAGLRRIDSNEQAVYQPLRVENLPSTYFIIANQGGNIRFPSISGDCALFELYGIETGGSRRVTMDFARFGTGCPADDAYPKYSTDLWTATGDIAIPPPGINRSIFRKLSLNGTGLYKSSSDKYTENAWSTGSGDGSNYDRERDSIDRDIRDGSEDDDIVRQNRQNNRDSEIPIPITYTPSLPPDATCINTDEVEEADRDGDRIYDCLEDGPGDTFNGLPLYIWGARADQIDLFMEMDYHDAVKPTRSSLDIMVDAIGKLGISLHIDAGDLFDGEVGIDPQDYDLGEGSTSYNFDSSRRSLFYYMQFTNNGPPFVGGMAQVGGIYSWIYASRAIVIYHEFGHNLGLWHGGRDDVKNFKPNYLSIMNYLYTRGLDQRMTPDAMLFYRSGISVCVRSTTNFDPADYPRMRFSYGTLNPLNEAALYENVPVHEGVYVDYRCDGITSEPQSIDLNGDGEISVLYDYNDGEDILEQFRLRAEQWQLAAIRVTGGEPSQNKEISDVVWQVLEPIYPDQYPVISIEEESLFFPDTIKVAADLYEEQMKKYNAFVLPPPNNTVPIFVRLDSDSKADKKIISEYHTQDNKHKSIFSRIYQWLRLNLQAFITIIIG